MGGTGEIWGRLGRVTGLVCLRGTWAARASGRLSGSVSTETLTEGGSGKTCGSPLGRGTGLVRVCLGGSLEVRLSGKRSGSVWTGDLRGSTGVAGRVSVCFGGSWPSRASGSRPGSVSTGAESGRTAGLTSGTERRPRMGWGKV